MTRVAVIRALFKAPCILIELNSKKIGAGLMLAPTRSIIDHFLCSIHPPNPMHNAQISHLEAERAVGKRMLELFVLSLGGRQRQAPTIMDCNIL